MSIHPVLIDSRPEYLGGEGSDASLLLLPIGPETLIAHLGGRLGEVTAFAPRVLAPRGCGAGYESQIAAVSPRARVIEPEQGLDALLGNLEPSDNLLLVEPRNFPLEGFDPRALVGESPLDPRWVVHLVAVGVSGSGTREYAEIDGQGRVRCVRRYYESVTWPFISGVVASLLPVSSLIGEQSIPLSLGELRGRLAGRGVPCRDVALPGAALDLHDEAGLLALVERHVRRSNPAGRESRPVFVGGGQKVAESARLVGPVVLHAGVVVEDQAVIVGPAVLAAGSSVGRGAIVAQGVVPAGTAVAAGSRVHPHSFLADSDQAAPPAAKRRRARRVSTPVRLAPAEELDERPRPRTRYMSWKRLIETSIAAALLLLLSPLMVVIALLIVLDSKGPIFYGHEREGLSGRRFRCLKFRSMQVGAQALERELHAQSMVDGPQFKLKKDPRVTRVGRILRLTNLDELPQLINVARGEMSIVGPRPSPFNENQLCVPWRQGRLSVRPGITGLWQVCRHDRSEGDFHQWIEYDLLYVRHMSLLLDVRIWAATFVSMGGQRPVSLAWVLPVAAKAQLGRSRSAA